MAEAVERIAATENENVLRGEGIDVVHGHATLTGPSRLRVDGWVVGWHRLVIATGTRPSLPPVAGLRAHDGRSPGGLSP